MKSITGASIILTEGCNLNCSYCYEKKKSPAIMSPEMAYKAVKFLVDNREESQPLSILWFGGEPLTNFSVLKLASIYATSLAEANGITIKQTVITNCTIWDCEIHSFFEENPHVNIQMSWDGLEQDNARGSSKKVLENIKKICTLPNKSYVHSQVTPAMAEYLSDNVDYMVNIVGDRPIALRPIAEMDGWTDAVVRKLYNEMFLVFSKHHDKIDRVKSCEHALKTNGICGAGKTFATITPSGELYACHRFYFDKNRNFKVGTLDGGFESSPKTSLLDNYKVHNIIGCSECASTEICDRCIAQNYLETGDPLVPSKPHCNISEAVFYSLLKYMKINKPWVIKFEPSIPSVLLGDYTLVDSSKVIQYELIPEIQRLHSELEHSNWRILCLEKKLEHLMNAKEK